jgi:hypothetical protein
LQFCRNYEETELNDLNALSVGWVKLTIALRIKDISPRHQLLRWDQRESWSQR